MHRFCEDCQRPYTASGGRNAKTADQRFLALFEKTAQTHRMLACGDAVLVAVSGGSDSVALLYGLSRLSLKYALKLGVAHVNHGLRMKESDHDAAFVAHLSHTLELPYFYARADIVRYQRQHKLSLEEAARDVRYHFLETVARENGYDKIALGHTSDDNVELVLMFILRGTGPTGLGGIPPKRDSRCTRIQIIRPLLELTKSEILAFLAENSLDYVSDRSNSDDTYLRNRIRHHLIPILKRDYNLKTIPAIRRLVAVMRAEELWTNESAAVLFEQAVVSSSAAQLELSLSQIAQFHIAARRRIIRMAVSAVKGDLRRITFRHIEAVLDLIENRSQGMRLDLPDRIRIERTKDHLFIIKARQPLRTLRPRCGKPDALDFYYEVPMPGKPALGKKALPDLNSKPPQSHKPAVVAIKIEETGDTLQFCLVDCKKDGSYKQFDRNMVFFDLDTLKFPLVVRNFRAGDRFKPMGMSGWQKVKKFFIDNKVDQNKRNRCPLLLSENNIVWIAGYRMDDAYKLRPHTQTMLRVELLLA
jgi:tRNA(Ile)-lysidine synthase